MRLVVIVAGMVVLATGVTGCGAGDHVSDVPADPAPDAVAGTTTDELVIVPTAEAEAGTTVAESGGAKPLTSGDDPQDDDGAASTTTMDEEPILPTDLQPEYPVVFTEGVTGPDTQDIAVWAPGVDGSWPVALLLHGWGARGVHYAATAELLAGQGMVVFAPDYRSTDIATADWKNTYRDVECAYRHARDIAPDYGGDIDAPITVIGHSIGASVALSIVLDEFSYGPEGPFDACPGDVPRADQVVALSGCYYRNLEDQPLQFAPAEWGWSNLDANIAVGVGADDEVCPAWQSQDAADQLIADGFESVEHHEIEGADHFSVIFTGYDNGPWYGPDVEWYAKPNDPGGVAATRIMVDAITTDFDTR